MIDRWKGVAIIGAVALATMTMEAHAQTDKLHSSPPKLSIVTFYSHGVFMQTGVPGTKNGIFLGSIFDGDQRLFSFYEGFVGKNDRFVTLTMPAGIHNFSASSGKSSRKEKHVTVNLEPNKRYYFRAQNESKGVIVWESEKGRLDQVNCQTVQDDAAKAKPLKPKHETQALRAMRVAEESIPPCDSNIEGNAQQPLMSRH